MKAAIALIFFACFAGSMASAVPIMGQLVQQGQAIAQAVIAQLQSQILALVQQAVGQLSALVGSIGRVDLSMFTNLLDQFKPLLESLAGQALGSVLGSLQGIFGGMSFFHFVHKY